MNRILVFAIVALIATAHHLPAPISEIETPTPAPRTAKPSQQAKSERVQSESKVSATTTSKTGRFAGTWSGVVPFKDPFVGGGGNQRCDFTVNSEETSMILRVSKVGSGSYHTATTRMVVIGNTASAKGGFLKHMSVTLTLLGDGSTATCVVHDSLWGTSSGVVKKIK